MGELSIWPLEICSSGLAGLEVQECLDSQLHMSVTHLKLEEVSPVGNLASCPFVAQVVRVGADCPACTGRGVPAFSYHRAVDACFCTGVFSVLRLIHDRYF